MTTITGSICGEIDSIWKKKKSQYVAKIGWLTLCILFHNTVHIRNSDLMKKRHLYNFKCQFAGF